MHSFKQNQKTKTKEYEVYQADLSPESVLFWRGQCEMFQGTAELSKHLTISEDLRESKLESLIGPLVEFCERIEKVWKNSCQNQNIHHVSKSAQWTIRDTV